MKALTEIASFGGIDADSDDLLEPCFQDHEAYLEACAHARWLITGRKGSGKTAIFKKLIRTRKYDFFAFGHTFSDYPWNHHNLQASIGVPEEQRYVHSWRYFILLTFAKVLLNQDQSQPWSEPSLQAISRLESFVVDSYGTRDPDVTQIFTPSKRLRIQPHLGIPGGGELGLNFEQLPVPDLPRVFQEVNRSITEAVMTCINPKQDYFVCFDELDRGFDPRDEQYAQMLVGLILAAKSINDEARRNGSKLSVVVFLRDDIYQLLQFEDKNKVTENCTAVIEWDSARTRWTLRNVMERRFGTVIAEQDVLSWNDVFDESQEMTGRQSKYQHIVDRTFRRPRDVIKFCNEVLDAFKRRGGGDKFSNDDIVNARGAYSEYLLRELDDEIHKHEPNYRNYLEVLRSVEALQFKRDEFEERCHRRPDLMPEGIQPIDVLRTLFEFSVIGYQRTGGAGGGSEYLWRYLDPTVRFDEAAVNFKVHSGFMEAFGLKKFRRTKGA